MQRLLLALVLGGIASFTGEAAAQFQQHADGRGYDTVIGSTTFRYRNDGSSSTHTQIGNFGFHNYNNGTAGTTIYQNNGRFDFNSNANQGWTGSGYTPYANPAATTYRRHYYRPAAPAFPTYGAQLYPTMRPFGSNPYGNRSGW